MKKQKSTFSKIISTLLVLVILGGLAVALYHFSDGFTNWDKLNPFNKPEDKPEQTITATIIESEKYGTFELPTNAYLHSSMSYELIYPHGTDFTYFFEENLELLPYISNNATLTKDTYKFVMCIIGSVEDDYFLNATRKQNDSSGEYLVFEENIIRYSELIKGKEYMLMQQILPMLFSEEDNNMVNFVTNVYCDSKSTLLGELWGNEDLPNAVNFNYSQVIISDKGYPLTELIYNEIMADSTTKISYKY